MLVAGGSTDVTTYFAMRLTADGKAATGLTPANFDMQYVRSGVAPVAKVDATALVATDSAHADNKIIEIDATDQPGLYRVDWPDAAFAAAVREVILTVKVATAFTEHKSVEIDGEVNVVEWAGTDVVAGAIPAAAADAIGGLPISDAGGLDMDAKLANTNEVTGVRMAALTDWIDGGRLDLLLDAIPTTTPLTAAQVNAEVVDVMKTDTITLPGQGAPPLTPTFEQALSWLYKVFRNRKTQTATQWSLMADDESTVDAKATVSDDATTAIKQEIVTGP